MDYRDNCSLCGHSNPPANRFCGQCGTSLTASEQLVPRREKSPAVEERSLPAKLKPTGRAVGKAVAASAAVLVAEATLAWLQRRAGLRTGAAQLSLPATQSDTLTAPPGYLIGQSLEEVFVRTRGDKRSELFVQRVVRVVRVPNSPEGPR